MHNTLSKIRGCQFLNLVSNNVPYQLVFTSDNMGGLYASVTHQQFSPLISQVGTPVRQDFSDKMITNEDRQVAQVNFEQKYTFEEVDISKIKFDLI